MNTNITIRVNEELAHEAKVLAARRGTSLSRLIAEQLRKMLNVDLRFDAARKRALKRLKRGYDLSWTPPVDRGELHDRQNFR